MQLTTLVIVKYLLFDISHDILLLMYFYGYDTFSEMLDMYAYLLSLLFAGYTLAISLENVPRVYNVRRATLDLHGPGYISALSLWQSSPQGLKTLVEKIIPPSLCHKSDLCSLYPANDSLVFDVTRYPNGNNYFFSLDWSQDQLAQKSAIHTVWGPQFSINYKEVPTEALELRDEEPKATETTSELPTSSTNSAAIMATGQTFAAIDPISIDVVLYETADSLDSTSTNSTTGGVAAAVAIATQSMDGLLRSLISVNTSGVLTVSTTSHMGLATLATATVTATASNTATTAKVTAVDGIGIAAITKPDSLVSVGILVAFGLLHL